MDYIGQVFGTRKIIREECKPEDWEKLGLRVPKRIDKYRLTQCMNCGTILPSEIKNLRMQPPKRCVFCSNIGNHSKVETYTNTWAIYDTFAICNVTFDRKIISFYIDSDDYERVKAYVWRISKKRQKYYVISGSQKKHTMIYLHEMIYGDHLAGTEIDHIDGNSLNNRRNNLRAVTRQGNIDNQRATRIDNQIGIRGVSYNRHTKKYKVDFYYHGERYYTRDWDTVEEAVWCRKCFEDYFDIPAIKNNPLAEQYYIVLDDTTKGKIQQYVQDKILGNER